MVPVFFFYKVSFSRRGKYKHICWYCSLRSGRSLSVLSEFTSRVRGVLVDEKAVRVDHLVAVFVCCVRRTLMSKPAHMLLLCRHREPFAKGQQHSSGISPPPPFDSCRVFRTYLQRLADAKKVRGSGRDGQG